MRVNATSLKNNLGRYLESSIKEPVIVEKSGRPSAVIVSYDEFEKLSHYEDFYWRAMASEAEKEGYLGKKESAKRLESYAKRAGIKIEDDEKTTRYHEAG